MSSKSGLSQMEAKVVCQKFFTLPGRRGTIEDEKVDIYKIEHFEHRADSLMSGKGGALLSAAVGILDKEDNDKDLDSSKEFGTSGHGAMSRKKARRPSVERRGSKTDAQSLRSDKEPKLDAFAAALQTRRLSQASDALGGSVRGGTLSQSRRGSTRGTTDELSNSRHGPASKESAGRGHKLQPSIHITKNPAGSIIRKAAQLSFSEEDLRKAILEARSANIMRGLLENRVRGPVYDDLVSERMGEGMG